MRVLPNFVSTALGLALLAGGIGAAYAEKSEIKASKGIKELKVTSETKSTKPTKVGGGTTGTTGTTTTATDPNCMPATLDPASEGRRAFMRMNCYSCHGGSGHGGTMGPSLVGVEPGEVGDAVLNGEDGGMPSFRNNLCANDVANLTAYLQTLGTPSEPKFMEWWQPNPTQ